MASPPDSHGVSLSVETAAAKLRSALLPKTVVSESCQNALGDAACGVNLAPLRVTSATIAGSTRLVINLSGSWTNGNWDLGTVRFDAGALAGTTYGIRSSAAGVLTLAEPAPEAPAAGVAVTLTPGCDHTAGAKGCSRFANLARFRAEPNLPRDGA